MFTKDDAGCWFDGWRGVYIGEMVQREALAHGWIGLFAPVYNEHYFEAWDEAEQYLNTLTGFPLSTPHKTARRKTGGGK